MKCLKSSYSVMKPTNMICIVHHYKHPPSWCDVDFRYISLQLTSLNLCYSHTTQNMIHNRVSIVLQFLNCSYSLRKTTNMILVCLSLKTYITIKQCFLLICFYRTKIIQFISFTQHMYDIMWKSFDISELLERFLFNEEFITYDFYLVIIHKNHDNVSFC